MLAMRVKTVNTQPGGKTVGGRIHRYRLRWSRGIGAQFPSSNSGTVSWAQETSFGTRGSGLGL